jgi:hypothetical protein
MLEATSFPKKVVISFFDFLTFLTLYSKYPEPDPLRIRNRIQNRTGMDSGFRFRKGKKLRFLRLLVRLNNTASRQSPCRVWRRSSGRGSG